MRSVLFPVLLLLMSTGCGPVQTKYDTIWDAIQAGDAGDVNLHLRKGTPIETDGSADGVTPFQYAVGNGKLACAKLLQHKGAVINPVESGKYDIRMIAALGGDTSVVGWLISLGLDFSVGDSLGLTPLSYAAGQGDTLMIRYLVDHGSRLDAPAGTVWPIHSAAGAGHLAAVKLFVEFGVDPDAHRLDDGTTPLWFAAVGGHTEVVTWLLSEGADPLGGRERGSLEASDMARSKGHYALALLLERAANPNLIALSLP